MEKQSPEKSELEKWLSGLKGRLDKATPGPWINGYSDGSGKVWSEGGATISKKINWHRDEDIVKGGLSGCETAYGVMEGVDAELIAHAPTDLKKAVRMLEILNKNIHPITGAMLDKIAAMTDEEIWKQNLRSG